MKSRSEKQAKAKPAPAITHDVPSAKAAWRVVAPALVAVLASLLLFWGLGDKFLWQDEANTAVLATRLLRFGRPLSYDGVNLITIDDFAVEQYATISARSKEPKAAVDYYVARGDYRRDTTWKFHPLGQFLAAALSMQVLGQTTIAARLPFAFAGLLTVALLWWLVRTHFRSDLMAFIASVLLVCNTYWILHSRQCRYYSLSSLFMLLTLFAYFRWQSGARWGAAAFVASAWTWFHVDYGTIWPVLAVLSIDCLCVHRKNLIRPVLAGASLAASLGPFIIYYQLWNRGSVHHEPWSYRFWSNLFNVNQYMTPLLVLALVAVLLVLRWKSLPPLECRFIAAGYGIIVALAVWVPIVAPTAFLRYAIMAAPVSCILGAWLVVRGSNARTVWACLSALVLILTPWFSVPLQVLNSPAGWLTFNSVANEYGFRHELLILAREVFYPPPDPNRIVIEWLRQNAKPTDEILVNYEDLPLMFYLPNPIRGGIAAFRAEDDAKNPPDFLVIRRSVPFVHWNVFAREVNRYRWIVTPLDAPDVMWGNNPDPTGQPEEFSSKKRVIVARRTESGTSRGVIFNVPNE